jgi:hypothetical protein
MACNSEYMNPTQKEANSKHVASLLVYVQEQLDGNAVQEYASAANSIYGNAGLLDEMTAELCCALKLVVDGDQETYDRIIYDAKNPMSRKLADWWEQHVEADLKRNDREEQLVAEMRNKEYAEYLRLKEKFGE